MTPENGKIGAYIAPNISLKSYKYGAFSAL
jgi:hypothetical protein